MTRITLIFGVRRCCAAFFCPRNTRIDANEDSETLASALRDAKRVTLRRVSVKAFRIFALFRVIRGPCKVFAEKQDFPAIAVRIRFAAEDSRRYDLPNVSLAEIKTAIEHLSFEERAELAAWLHGWNDDEWDEQMKRDVASGKLDTVLHEVEEDIKAGRVREMP